MTKTHRGSDFTHSNNEDKQFLDSETHPNELRYYLFNSFPLSVEYTLQLLMLRFALRYLLLYILLYLTFLRLSHYSSRFYLDIDNISFPLIMAEINVHQ